MASASGFRSYRLSCRLNGHEKDVKAVCSVTSPTLGGGGGGGSDIAAACLASASRDCTARVWSPAATFGDRGGGIGGGYTECLGLCAHSGYVNSIAWMPPADWCPFGLLYTAGMDKVINAFTLESPEPVARLEGHEANVCSLSCAPSRSRLLLSSSWDRTARVWHQNVCICVISGGHDAAVWSAISFDPESAVVVTAGADRIIKLWTLDAESSSTSKSSPPECVATLRGHSDAVRGLCRLPGGRFLSCSNDATVRLWRLHSEDCQMTYEGHSGFVYSVAALPQDGLSLDDGIVEWFASSSEDRTCRVWCIDSGACLQTLAMPCQSLWAICSLANGDLAVAGSDATICIFTADAARFAAPDELIAFESSVAESAIPTKIGDLDTDKLPGPDVLNQPGRREGQVMMIRRGPKIEAHQWSSADARWQKVGDVVGGQGGETVSGGGGGGVGNGKTRFEGQDYDFVFTVDVKEGEPPLQLPYNRTEDPWFAAQRFIDKHGLPQDYLDQVAGFIRSNAGEAPTISVGGGYSDPYTGSGRYIPGGGGLGTETAAFNSDPFTGGSRYVPGGGGGGPVVGRGVTAELKAKYLPFKQLQILSAANTAGLKKKLAELAGTTAALPDGLLERLDALIESGGSEVEDASLLRAVASVDGLQAVADFVPLLDLLRLAVRFEAGATALTVQPPPSLLRRLLARFLGSTSTGDSGSSTACQMLAARLVANLAGSASGSAWLTGNRDWLLDRLDGMEMSGENANWQVAVASALCNLCILTSSSSTSASPSSSSTSAMIRLLTSLHRFMSAAGASLKEEAAFLAIASIGTLLTASSTDEVSAMAKDFGLKHLISRFTDPAYAVRVTELATVVTCLI